MDSPTALPAETETAAGSAIHLFRPSKKRKTYRQRLPPDGEPPLAPPQIAQSIDELIATSSGGGGDDGREEAMAMSEILRRRNQKKKRVGGVGFKAFEGARDDGGTLDLQEGNGEGEEEGKRERGGGGGGEDEGGETARVVRRFAPQTGIGGAGMNVDKHMMAYIDSELAKRRSESHAHTQVPYTTAKQSRQVGEGERRKDIEVQRQPATLGKLLEIDLGDEARDRNVAQTELARRRLVGEEVEEEGSAKPVKTRLGPDGKPWRGRKRRGSDDIKRDRLVEDLLRENRLEIYDELPVESAAINDDQAADDRIAEAFRREFMDAVSQRHRKKDVPSQAPARGAGGKKTEEELMKGPKLGGSRSARAAHMNMLKQQNAK